MMCPIVSHMALSTDESPVSQREQPPSSPLVVAILCGVLAGSFAGQGARMMVDGFAATSVVLYGVAFIIALFGAFWFRIRQVIWPHLAQSVSLVAGSAWAWFIALIVLLASLSLSPLM